MIEQYKLKGNCKECGKKNSDRIYPAACPNAIWLNDSGITDEEFPYGNCKFEDMLKSNKIPGVCRICDNKYYEHIHPVFSPELGRICIEQT